MVDLRDEVVNILSSIADIDYQYPQILVDAANNNKHIPQDFFPHISFWDSDHNGEHYLDGKAVTDDVEITIDCWERQDKNGNLIEIHFEVDQAMRNAGYRRTMYVPQFEEDTKIYHYSFKFKKLMEESE